MRIKIMVKFIIRLCLFLSPLIVVLGLLEYKLTYLPNSYLYKKSQLEKKLKQTEVLIVGNSHAYYGINPSPWPVSGFNLANVSQSLYYDAQLVDIYKNLLPKLKLVIISIEYLSLEYQMKNTNFEWREFFYKHYWKINSFSFSPLDLRNYSLMAIYTPTTVLKFATQLFQVNLIEGINEDGWFKSESLISNPSEPQALKRVQFHHSLMNKNQINENINILRHLMDELKKKNIQVVLVSLPVTTSYSQLMDSEKLLRLGQGIRALQSEYPIKHYNYMNDSRFSLDDFGDYDHLNATGAAKFSKIFYQDAIEPVVDRTLTTSE